MHEVSRQRRWQIRKQAEGLCISCGKRPLADGQYCTLHKRKQRARWVLWYEANKVWYRRNQLRRYNRLKAAGRCVQCAGRRGRDGTKTSCRPCADRFNQRYNQVA